MQKINLRELYPDVYKTDVFVDVAEEVAGHVLAVLNRGVFICGTRVTAVVDDSGTGAAHPRKPLNFGPRRQRPVKYGKKPRGAAHERGE